MTEVDNDLGLFEYAYVGQTGRVSGVDYPNGMTAVYDDWTRARPITSSFVYLR